MNHLSELWIIHLFHNLTQHHTEYLTPSHIKLYQLLHMNPRMADVEIAGQPVSEADRKILTVQKMFGGLSFLWELLAKLLKISDDYCQKIWYDINNTEKCLPKTLYNTSFHKLSQKCELFWVDFGPSLTCFAEIIRSLTHADRNTFHYFQVCRMESLEEYTPLLKLD